MVVRKLNRKEAVRLSCDQSYKRYTNINYDSTVMVMLFLDIVIYWCITFIMLVTGHALTNDPCSVLNGLPINLNALSHNPYQVRKVDLFKNESTQELLSCKNDEVIVQQFSASRKPLKFLRKHPDPLWCPNIERSRQGNQVSLYSWSPVLLVSIRQFYYLHANGKIFSCTVESNPVKLDISSTVIVPIQ